MDRLIGVVRERMAQVMAMRFNKWMAPEEYDEQARAALAALQREWAVVPREPTDAMLTAAWNECTAGDARTYRQAWAAMIAAAPQPEEAP